MLTILGFNGSIPVFSSESTNNGIIGYTEEKADFLVDDENPLYIIFGDHTRSFNIASQDFCVADNVKVLLPKSMQSIRTLLYIVSSWKKCINDKGYSRHWSIAKGVSFNLPIKNDTIDYNFMESFIAELEAYLSVTGLKDMHLSIEEELALDNCHKIQWGEFKIGDLFDRVPTIKLPYKADELPKEPLGKYVLPCLTSSFKNQGLNYYAAKEGATILKNVISIPSNSDVYRAYYQSREFTVLSDAYAISWKSDKTGLSANKYLFMVSCINKVTDLSIYSYKNKLGGWNVVKNKYILLPLKDEHIDFDFMENIISAIQKLVIKDVVAYSNSKISTTKKSGI